MPSTSPSIYVAFRSLNATNLCGLVGTAISRTTLAFAPDALSTDKNIEHSVSDKVGDRYNEGFLGFRGQYTWSSFNYMDLQ